MERLERHNSQPCSSSAACTSIPSMVAPSLIAVRPKKRGRAAEIILTEAQARSYLPKQMREKRSATVSPKKDPYGALSDATLSPLARPASVRTTTSSIRTSSTTLGLHAVLTAKPLLFKGNMRKSVSDYIIGCEFFLSFFKLFIDVFFYYWHFVCFSCRLKPRVLHFTTLHLFAMQLTLSELASYLLFAYAQRTVSCQTEREVLHLERTNLAQL